MAEVWGSKKLGTWVRDVVRSPPRKHKPKRHGSESDSDDEARRATEAVGDQKEQAETMRPVDSLKEVCLVSFEKTDNGSLKAISSSTKGIPLSEVAGALLGIDDTPQRMRFIDCAAFVDKNILTVREMDTTDIHPYAAVSYVWRGLEQKSDPEDEGSFSVRGAEGGDPISIRLLRTACIAARKFGCNLLWLDRLGVLQTDKDDKSWQIKHMATLYSHCKVCLVLPGGVSRLASLFESTQWVERAWTLQEALLPKEVVCLFAWTLGPLGSTSSASVIFILKTLEEGRSAFSPLDSIVGACSAGKWAFRMSLAEEHSDEEIEAYCRSPDGTSCVNFNSRREGQDFTLWVRILGNKTAIITAMMGATFQYAGQHERELGIWRSAFLRSSSRPVDMVFSIMGLFGVTLDPSKYDSDDRRSATIALAQAILERKGDKGRADWLGISKILDPSPDISVFPTFPQTSVQGSVTMHTSRGKDIDIHDLVGKKEFWNWYLRNAPKGTLDDNGNFHFEAKAAKIVRFNKDTYKINYNGIKIEYDPKDDVCFEEFPEPDEETASDGSDDVYAVVLGDMVNSGNPAHGGHFVRVRDVVVMIVKRAEGNRSYRLILDEAASETTKKWKTHRFCIGPFPQK